MKRRASAKRLNARERRRLEIKRAMPEVKKLVRRFGRTAVANCVAKLGEFEREHKKLEQMKAAVKTMERRLAD